MNTERFVSIGSAIIFFTIAAIFGFVLYHHVGDRGFNFKHIDVPARPGSEGTPQQVPPTAGFRSSVTIGPGGQVTSQSYQNGVALDAPLQSFAGKFNEYIDQINEQHRSENGFLIALDIVGVAAALLSGLLELIRPVMSKSTENGSASSYAIHAGHNTRPTDQNTISRPVKSPQSEGRNNDEAAQPEKK